MFTQLKSLLTSGRSLIITASGLENNNIRLTVTPKRIGNGKKDEDEDDDSKPSVLDTPLVVTGSAEELDAELPGALTQFTEKRISAEDALSKLDKEFEAEKKAASTRIEAEKKKGNAKPTAGAAAPAKAAPAKPAPEATTAQSALF